MVEEVGEAVTAVEADTRENKTLEEENAARNLLKNFRQLVLLLL